MKPGKFSHFQLKIAAGIMMLILAGYMYYSDNNNQYAVFIGIGAVIILNAYSMGNKKKK